MKMTDVSGAIIDKLFTFSKSLDRNIEVGDSFQPCVFFLSLNYDTANLRSQGFNVKSRVGAASRIPVS